jgi:hypothetical protein
MMSGLVDDFIGCLKMDANVHEKAEAKKEKAKNEKVNEDEGKASITSDFNCVIKFSYLRGTIDIQLTFRGELTDLVGYSDSDWGGDPATHRSTAGFVFNIGSGAISWSSKRQPTVALSTCEAEYQA